MKPIAVIPLLAGLALAALASHAAGSLIRVYDAARHDRFTGFPSAPAWNDAAWFGSRDYTGVGWYVADVRREMALVSPLHAVCARHFIPATGGQLRFLNADGVTVTRTVAAVFDVNNDLGQKTDLALVKLDSPILAADKVTPLPYLDLSAESDYENLSMVVFGWYAKAGRANIISIEDFSEAGVINETKGAICAMRKDCGNPDDCHYQGGDSGSPSFVTVNGAPALTGIHTAIDEDSHYYYLFDTFVPHYAAKLNALMAPDGYQLTALAPAKESPTLAFTPTPGTWRQSAAVSGTLALGNPATTAATNVSMILRFHPDHMPTTLDAPGWTVSYGTGGAVSLNLASLAAGASTTVTASWASAGTAADIAIGADVQADGVVWKYYDFSTPVVETYAAWSGGLAQPGTAADGDGDGLPNLAEYAFGGDPAVASQYQPAGAPLLPRIAISSGGASIAFPVRSDATARGISYGAPLERRFFGRRRFFAGENRIIMGAFGAFDWLKYTELPFPAGQSGPARGSSAAFLPLSAPSRRNGPCCRRGC